MFDIFIFCGGKCGGSSLTNTCINNNFKTIHVHSFRTKGFKYNIIDINILPQIIKESALIKPIYIIDSYRTPIERKMSSFFQHIQFHIPDYKTKTIEELIQIFNVKLIYELEEYHSINQALSHFHIPLWTTFDFEKGYNLVEKDNKIFVKLLFRDIDKWDSLLTEILGQPITLHSENISDEKEYATIYKEFKALYKIPRRYLDEHLPKDREFKIYNTAEEQKDYLDKWSAMSI